MEFPPEVTEQIGYYVYALSEPGADRPFYIGKGTGNRVFAHAAASVAHPTDSEKLSTIREILASGRQVKYQIIRHGMTEDQALEVEAALIDYLGLDSLTNVVSGLRMRQRGMMRPEEIIAQYAAAAVTISEPSLLIIINKLYRRNMTDAELYEATRGDWVLGKDREKAEYAFAVYHGVIRQAYSIDSWQPVRAKGPAKIKNRWKFSGSVAGEMQAYVGGSVSGYVRRGRRSPVLYLNCKAAKR